MVCDGCLCVCACARVCVCSCVCVRVFSMFCLFDCFFLISDCVSVGCLRDCLVVVDVFV